MDNIQKLLIVVILILTALLCVIGIQVILIILDLRRALKRLNSILEDALLGGGLIRPEKLTGILEFLSGKRRLQKRGQGDFPQSMPPVD